MQQYGAAADEETITPKTVAPPAEEKGFLDIVADIGKGIISGPIKEAENVTQAIHDTADFIDNKLGSGEAVDDDKDYDFVPDALKPETGWGETAQSLAAFATGWITGGKLLKYGVKTVPVMTKLAAAAPNAPKFVKTAMGGGVIDFLSGDGSDKRLADTIVDNDLFGSSLAQYLASKDDDTMFEARLKNVAEGFIIGSALDSAMTAFKYMKQGAKASAKGSLDKSIAIRKEGAAAAEAAEKTMPETAEKTVTETAGKTVSSVDELKETMGEKWATPSVEKYTPKAQLKKAAQEQKKDLAGHIDQLKKAFNTKQYGEEATAIIDGFQDSLDVATLNDHMSMAALHTQALEYTAAHNLDKTFDKTALLRTGGLSEIDPRVAVHTQANWLNVFMPDHVSMTLQQVKEGADGAIGKARQLAEDIFDVTLDLKRSGMESGQIAKAMDITPVAAAASGTKLTTEGIQGNAETLAHQLITKQSDEEIIKMLSVVKTLGENGNIKEIKSVIAAASNGDKEIFKLMGVPMDTVLDSVYKWRYIAMLSSMKTHMRNFVGNTAKVPLIAFEEAVQGAALGWQAGEGVPGKIIGALAGAKDRGAYFIQGLYYAKRQAWESLQNAWRYNEALTRPSEYTNLVKQSDWGWKEWPLKALKASDEFFASWTGTAKAYEQAMLDLKASGVLKGAAPELRAEITAKWLDDYIGNSFTSMTMKDGTVIERAGLALKDMRQIADEATFQQELGKFGKSLNTFVNSAPGAKLVMPFVKTPMNIFKDVFWTRGPGAIMEIGQAMKSGDPEAQAKAISHLTSAVFLWTTAYELAQSGKITGQGPENKNQRQRLLDTGWQSHCYRTEDGSYLDLNALEPYGSLLSFFADMTERGEREGLGALDLDNVWTCLLTTVKDKTFLKGLSEFMLSMDRGTMTEHNGFVAQMGMSFVPSLLRDLGQAIDPIRRETPDFYAKIADRIPGMRENLTPKINWLTGEERGYAHGGGAGSFFNMWSGGKDNGSAVFYELSRLTGVGDPSDEIQGMKLSPEQYADYCQTIGKLELGGRTLYQTLDEVINSDAYQRDIEQRPDPSPYEVDENRAKRLRQVIKAYKDAGKAQFLRDNPQIATNPNILSAITDA